MSKRDDYRASQLKKRAIADERRQGRKRKTIETGKTYKKNGSK